MQCYLLPLLLYRGIDYLENMRVCLRKTIYYQQKALMQKEIKNYKEETRSLDTTHKCSCWKDLQATHSGKSTLTYA